MAKAREITHIVVHHNGVDGRTIRHIRRSHLAFGWREIGYHAVIHEDGSVHAGRDEAKAGAHTAGLNKHSLAVCLIGNLNKHAPGGAQLDALENLLVAWCRRYGLTSDDILGHRETAAIVPKLVATKKSCPGTQVNMDVVRARVAERVRGVRHLVVVK